jgi:hypothetical protein
MSGQYKTLAKTGAIVDTRFKNSMKAAAARAAGAAIGVTLVFGGIYVASLFGAEAGVDAVVASRVVHASRIAELGSEEGTVVLGHFKRLLPFGVQETLPILENAAQKLGGRTLSSLPGRLSAIIPELEGARRVIFFTCPGMTGLTASEMDAIQSSTSLMLKTTFVYGGF